MVEGGIELKEHRDRVVMGFCNQDTKGIMGKAGTLLVDMQGQRQLGPRAVCYLLRCGEF